MYRVRARNTATASSNKIHDDAVARRFGFGGGLVPGVTLFAYMTRPVMEVLGVEFLERGRMDARFVQPAYEGDEITVEATADLDLSLKNAAGVVCAEGSATIGGDVPDIADYPSVAPVSPPPVASEEAFAAHATLGTIEGHFSADSVAAYLELIEDDLDIYRRDRLAHPGWLLTWANLMLSTNFQLGPWIHTSSNVSFHSKVVDGDELQARGRVNQTFERKGHRFVELDVVLIANGSRPAMKVRHVAIYEPRQPL